MEYVINETTATLHKYDRSETRVRSTCGATLHLEPDTLRIVTSGDADAGDGTSKCGRCFDDGGSY